MSQLAHGVGDLGRGFRFLNAHAGLWRWVIAPAAITLAILVGLIVAVAHVAAPLVTAATDWLPASLQGAGSGLVWVLVAIALALGALLVFVAVVGVVAGPFCELLSEAVEERATGERGPAFALGPFLRGAAAGLAHGARRLLVSLIGMALVIAIGFVPVVGTIAAAALGGWLAARASAYDCYDAVLSRRALSYDAKLAYLARHRGRTLGLGAGVAGLLLVPGVNLVALGVGAAGATLAALELEGRGHRRAAAATAAGAAR